MITYRETKKVSLLLVEKKEDQPNVTNRFPPSNKDRRARAAQCQGSESNRLPPTWLWVQNPGVDAICG